MLVIRDSVTRSVILALPATVYRLTGARVSDVAANLRDLAQHRENHRTHTHTRFGNTVIHVGSNNVRTKQSEITRESQARMFQFARKMSLQPLIVSGPLPMKGNDEMYSRLSSLSLWLAHSH